MQSHAFQRHEADNPTIWPPTGLVAIESRCARKALIGPRLRARGFAAQQTEAAIGVAVLNRMLAAGRPKSVQCQPVIE